MVLALVEVAVLEKLAEMIRQTNGEIVPGQMSADKKK